MERKEKKKGTVSSIHFCITFLLYVLYFRAINE